jgi:hypothetical protein
MPENGATPYDRRNKEFLARGVFYLFNCCTNARGKRKTQDGEHLNRSRCKAATSRLFDKLSDGTCRKSPHVNELGNPQITQISQIQEGGTRPAVVASLPFASWFFFRNLWESVKSVDDLFWFPHTSTPHPRTFAQGRFRGVDAAHAPAAGPACQPRRAGAAAQRPFGLGGGQQRVHLRRSSEAVHGPNPFRRRPISGFPRRRGGRLYGTSPIQGFAFLIPPAP